MNAPDNGGRALPIPPLTRAKHSPHPPKRTNMKLPEPIHLSNGAYASVCPLTYGLLITINHRLPRHAQDNALIEPSAIPALKAYIAEMERLGDAAFKVVAPDTLALRDAVDAANFECKLCYAVVERCSVRMSGAEYKEAQRLYKKACEVRLAAEIAYSTAEHAHRK